MVASLERNCANRDVIEYTMDVLSILEVLVKKGRLHRTRYGETPERKNIIWPII